MPIRKGIKNTHTIHHKKKSKNVSHIENINIYLRLEKNTDSTISTLKMSYKALYLT